MTPPPPRCDGPCPDAATAVASAQMPPAAKARADDHQRENEETKIVERVATHVSSMAAKHNLAHV